MINFCVRDARATRPTAVLRMRNHVASTVSNAKLDHITLVRYSHGSSCVDEALLSLSTQRPLTARSPRRTLGDSPRPSRTRGLEMDAEETGPTSA